MTRCEATTLAGWRCHYRGPVKAPNGQHLCNGHARRARRLGLAGYGRLTYG